MGLEIWKSWAEVYALPSSPQGTLAKHLSLLIYKIGMAHLLFQAVLRIL